MMRRCKIKNIHVFLILTIITTYLYFLAFQYELTHNSSLKKPYPAFLSQDAPLNSGVREVTNESCYIPDFNPFDPRAMKFISYRPSINCGDLQPILTYIDLGFIILNTSAVRKEGWEREDIKCTYVEIDRITEIDNDVEYGPQKTLEDKAAVSSPVVQVQCEKKGSWGNIYENVHYVLKNLQRPLYHSNQETHKHFNKVMQFNESVNLEETHNRKNHTENFAEIRNVINSADARASNVLIVTIDGLSRLNALRMMPQTTRYLKEQLNAYIFQKHVKCGQNSFPNLAALITGRRSYSWRKGGIPRGPELPHCRNNACDQEFVDDWPFVWKDFERKGYITAFGEDKPYIGIFNYLMKGFLHPPTHHYFRPLWIAQGFLKSSGTIASMSKDLCFLNVPEFQHILNQAMDIQKTYRSQPHFSYFHTNVAHGDMNLFQSVDTPVKNFVSQLKEGGLLDNTFLIIMGDHGYRYGDFRKTWLGRMDDNLPLFSLLVPEKVKKRYPHLHEALQSNVRTVTSWYDVHATLMDIAYSNYGVEEREWNPTGLSLFRKIEDRSCSNTGVPLAFCPCLSESKMNVTDDVAVESANTLVETMNTRMSKFSKYCSQLTVKEIQEASAIKMRSVKVGLILTVVVSPSGGILETTLTFDNQKQRFTVTEDVQRLDEYKDQGSCIRDKEYRPFCHCR